MGGLLKLNTAETKALTFLNHLADPELSPIMIDVCSLNETPRLCSQPLLRFQVELPNPIYC